MKIKLKLLFGFWSVAAITLTVGILSATLSILTLSLVILLSFVITFIISYFLSRNILKQIGGEPTEIANITEQIAIGKFDLSAAYCQKKEITGIYAAIKLMIANFKTVIEDIVQVSQALADGTQNVAPLAEYQGDFAQIKNALSAAAEKLADTTAQKNRQDWLKAGQAQLNQIMRGEQEIEILAKNIVSFLSTYVDASVGLFYLMQESKQTSKSYLQLIASYAYTANISVPSEFLVGEGLIGQAALEQQVIFRIHAPEEYKFIIQSGLSQTVPRYVIILPFLYEKEVKGVIEIGSSEMLSEIQGEFLEQVMASVGITVNSAESRTQMHALLKQTKQQAEELQYRQEKLQQSNEELQTQSEELQTRQQELRQANDSLEGRTRDLEHQKSEIQQKNLALEQTKAEMEKAKTAIEAKAKELALTNKYKSEFLANMSHELRTPLNSLLILAQLLKDNKQGNLTDKQVEYAKTIFSSGSDLLALINEILDLSKVESGKIELQLENLSIADLITKIDQKFRHVAEDKVLAFNITLANDIPATLYTDGQRLIQIINNLLSNAFKFTGNGEIKLTVQRPSTIPLLSVLKGNMLESDKSIVISVSDTGIGIPEDKQQIIFKAFQQVDGTTSRRYGGTGLGLSISRQLAQLLGGELTLDSKEGKGSTFTLYLPETKALDAQNIKTPEVQVSQELAEPSQLTLVKYKAETAPIIDINSPIRDERNDLQSGDQSILIIEDDQEFSGTLINLAHDKGFKCLIAEDGVIGLQLAEKYNPDAIILDVELPQLNGWGVMEKLKNNPNTRHIPVHFISTDEQGLDAQRMGAIGSLVKQANLEQLEKAFQKIEHFLAKTAKNLLVAVDVDSHQHKILESVGTEGVQLQLAPTVRVALQQLQMTTYDCIILDMDIENGSGIKLLEQMQQGLCQTPLIVYADRDLTPSEEELLLQCTNKIPIKSVNSPERLLDEVTLFLHQVEANLPVEKRNMLRVIHDKKAIYKYKKVLIIDDDMRNTFAIATVLEEFDMEVVVASDGKEGITVLNDNDDIAIILMDIMMPEMDGYETMREIRKQPKFTDIPIIALTAKAMKGDKAKCIEAGANDYLAKPVDTEKLLSLVRVWLHS